MLLRLEIFDFTLILLSSTYRIKIERNQKANGKEQAKKKEKVKDEAYCAMKIEEIHAKYNNLSLFVKDENDNDGSYQICLLALTTRRCVILLMVSCIRSTLLSFRC